IVWKINKEQAHKGGSGLKIFYGSVHDILSYPMESGDEAFIKAASVCLMAHDQYIWNVHLEQWQTRQDYDTLYQEAYHLLLRKATTFLRPPHAKPQNSLIFISCGFDASEYEYPSMQRHGRSVPVSFYYQFTSDVVQLAKEFTLGKVISVLEGG